MERKKYVQPEIEVLQIEVEKGFAQSSDPGSADGNAGGSGWSDWN